MLLTLKWRAAYRSFICDNDGDGDIDSADEEYQNDSSQIGHSTKKLEEEEKEAGSDDVVTRFASIKDSHRDSPAMTPVSRHAKAHHRRGRRAKYRGGKRTASELACLPQAVGGVGEGNTVLSLLTPVFESGDGGSSEAERRDDASTIAQNRAFRETTSFANPLIMDDSTRSSISSDGSSEGSRSFDSYEDELSAHEDGEERRDRYTSSTGHRSDGKQVSFSTSVVGDDVVQGAAHVTMTPRHGPPTTQPHRNRITNKRFNSEIGHAREVHEKGVIVEWSDHPHMGPGVRKILCCVYQQN